MFFDQTRTKYIIQYHYNTSYLLFVIFLDERYWIYFSLEMLYTYFTNFFKWHKSLSVVKTYTFFTFLINNKHLLNLTLVKEIHLFLDTRLKHDYFFFFLKKLMESIKNVFISMSNIVFFNSNTYSLDSKKLLICFSIKMDIIEETRFFFYYTYKYNIDLFFEHFVCLLSPYKNIDIQYLQSSTNSYNLKSILKKVLVLIKKKEYNSFFFKYNKDCTFFNTYMFYRLKSYGNCHGSIKKLIRLLLFYYNKLLNQQQRSVFNFIYNKVSIQASQLQTEDTFTLSKYFLLEHQKKYLLVLNNINKDMCAKYLK